MDRFGDRVLEFSDEALLLASNYAKEVESRILGFQASLRPDYVEMLVFDIENDVKFFALKKAAKRGAEKVEAVDVEGALKTFGKPEEFIKSHIGKAENCLDSQRNTLGTLEAIKEKLDQVPTPMVLDAGCRWGRVSKKLDSSKNLQIVGVDLDKLSLQYGKTVNTTTGFILSDIQALPFKSQVFDVILCSGVIHEVKNVKGRREVIREFSRILGAKRSVYLIDAFAKFRIISVLTFVLQNVSRNIEWIPKKEAIEKMLKENGFELTTIRTSSSPFSRVIVLNTLVATKI
jgi:2-polyprenyl-3-methyl-5-hydroxy-6-metoxy-1,4-benzoquinol methylase